MAQVNNIYVSGPQGGKLFYYIPGSGVFMGWSGCGFKMRITVFTGNFKIIIFSEADGDWTGSGDELFKVNMHSIITPLLKIY